MATDKERLDAAANWIRQNQDKQGTPEWEKVTGAYKELRGAQSAAPEAAAPKTNPFLGKPINELKSAYASNKAAGNNDALPLIADAYVAGEQSNMSPLGALGTAVDTTVRQLGSGVPVVGGLLDEANAGVSSLMGGDYGEALDYQRALDRKAHADAPVLSGGLNLLGGIGGTLAGARALGVGGFGIGSSKPLLQRALTGLGIGAPVGAADSFARGEGGAESRGLDALVGAGIGGVTGLAAPLIGQGVSSAYQGIANWLRPNANLSALGIGNPEAKVLMRSLGSDEMGGAGTARIRDAGPNAMVADAGPNAAGVLDATIQRGGPGATIARQAVEERATQANQQLRGTLDTTFGPAQGVAARQEAIRLGTAGARGRTYTAAYDQPIDYAAPEGQHIDSLLPRIPQRALTYANELMKTEGNASKQIKVKINPDGTVAFEKMPDVRQLDYITRALNDVAKGADGQGALGGQTAVGRAYGNLSQEIRQTMRAAVPEYGQALDTAADPIRRIQAIDFGSTLLNPKVTRNEVADELRGMSVAERKSVLEGLRDNLDEVSATVKEMASDPNVDARQLKEILKGLTSQASREKVSLALGDPQKAMAFYKDVSQASKALELKAQVATNSRTAARQEAFRAVDQQTQPGVIGLAMEGELPKASKRAIGLATGATPEQALARDDKVWEGLAKALTQIRGPQAETLLSRLLAAMNARNANSATGRNLGIAAAGTVAGSQPSLRGSIPVR